MVVSESRNSVRLPPGASFAKLAAVFEQYQERDERKGWIGFMIPLLQRHAGLVELDTRQVTGTLEGVESIQSFYDLETLTARLYRDGGIDVQGVSEVHHVLDRYGNHAVLTVQTSIFAGSVPGPDSTAR